MKKPRTIYNWFFLFMMLISSSIHGENLIFHQDQLLWYVKKYHPIAKQADLLIEAGESTERKARGAFDPSLNANVDQKYYDNETYYNIIGSGLTVPTWYGIELKAGFDQTSGEFLNPQNTVPQGGLWYGGIKIPVGQGLFVDQRRKTLRQAQIYYQSSQAQQKSMLNDLYFDAITTYWNWVQSWNKLKVYEESVSLAEERFYGVKQGYIFGDVPAIDTLEAFIQVQNRVISKNNAELQYQNQTLVLSNFLWFENNTPLVISDSLRPPSIESYEKNSLLTSDSLNSMLLALEADHPELLQITYNLEMMEWERKWSAERIKPRVDLRYNILSESVGVNENTQFLSENYTWGLTFNFPLFLRKERGDLQLARIKIKDMKFQKQQTVLEIQNKVRAFYNEQLNLDRQIDLFSDAVRNYEGLLSGERQKFNAGESSVFLVNSRETNYINSRLKLIEFITEYEIYDSGIFWSLGRLHKI